MSNRKGTNAPLRARISNTEKLLWGCRTDSSSEAFVKINIGDAIVTEADFDCISRMLGKLDLSRIPKERNRAADRNFIDEATNSIYDIATITGQIPAALDTQASEAYKKRFHPMLLERWPDMIHWLEFLLSGPALSFDVDTRLFKLMFVSCYILDRALTNALDGDTYLEDAMTARCTVKFLFFLLCKREDEHPRQLYHVSLDHENRGLCRIAKLFSDYGSSPFGSEALQGYLMSISGRRRAEIMQSLVSRGYETACRRAGPGDVLMDFEEDIATSLTLILRGIFQLAALNRTIWKAFTRAQGLSRYVLALCTVSERAEVVGIVNADVWNRISVGVMCLSIGVVVLSPRLTSVLVKGGQFLTCMRRCLIYGDADSIQQAHCGLRMVLPYFHLSKVFLAVDSPEEVAEWMWPMKMEAQEGNTVTAECKQMLRLAMDTYHSRCDRFVSCCSNTQHHTLQAGSSAEESVMMTCSGCYAVSYCSVACQRQDWALHSRECSILSAGPRGPLKLAARKAMGVIREQLRFIDTMVNSSKLFTHESYEQATDPIPSPCLLDKASITTFDVCTQRESVTRKLTVSTHTVLTVVENGAYDLWMPRLHISHP